LALESDTDLDEALVALWDAGLDDIDDEGSVIAARDIRRARRVLGLEDNRAAQSVEYWLVRSGLSRVELTERLSSVGIVLSPDARRIPKNSLRRLRSMFVDSPVDEVVPAEPPVPPQIPPLNWRTIGNSPIHRYLDESEIKAIHEALERDFCDSGDPISPPGVRDENLLSSAAHRPKTSHGEHLKYPTVEMAAAALFHSVVLNHAFHNGNKRTGFVSLLAFLDENDLVLTSSEDELFKITLRVAQHGIVSANADQLADREVQEIARWIRSNSRPVRREERMMKWHKLRSRLSELGCEMEPASGGGSRLNIRRTVYRKKLLGLRRTPVVLRTQVAWTGDNTEADKKAIHWIRSQLELDDANDVDSATFYEGAKVDAFIADYRRILKRLAKL
jgi:death-on-curing family protein